MLGALLGFAAPFLPDVMKMVKGRLDHKQEMQMMELRFANASAEHEWKMAELTVKADTIDIQSARKPRQSYGVQLLDAASKVEGEKINGKAFNTAFLLFTLADFVAALTRPFMTYWIVGFWGAVKVALLYSIFTAAGGEWSEALVKALTSEQSWTEFDQEVTQVVIGFWFGWRTRQRAANPTTK